MRAVDLLHPALSLNQPELHPACGASSLLPPVAWLAGVNRRLWDGGAQYAHAQDVLFLNIGMSHAAMALGFFQLFFIANLFVSIRGGRPVRGNPWDATTLEWREGHGPLRVYRDPYDYTVPGAATDFLPQHQPADAG